VILNSRQNSFAFLFPPTFFSDEVKEKYKDYYKNQLLPFDRIDEFMSFTIQQIDFPGWEMTPVQQVRVKGKRQEYKSSKPIEDLFQRTFTLTFKLTDAFLNYFIWLDNSLAFNNFETKDQYTDPMRLILLNNEGYIVSSVVFDKPFMIKQSGLPLSQSSITPEFNTFSVTFQYFRFKIEVLFD